MFVLSVLLGIIPLLGIGWILWQGSLATVDGLFASLILLTLSGILLSNAIRDARAWRHVKLAGKQANAAPAQKSSTSAQVQAARGESAAEKARTAAQAQETTDTPQAQKTA